jgi:hypothetical protein
VCRRIEAELDKSHGEKIFKSISEMNDQGPTAQCCDHPYTSIEITYADGQKRMLTSGGDLLNDYEKNEPGKEPTLFGLTCKSGSQD